MLYERGKGGEIEHFEVEQEICVQSSQTWGENLEGLVL
jgi:hypothetical protein